MRTDQLFPSRRSKSHHAAHSPRKLFKELLESRLLLAQTTGLFFNDPGTMNGYVLMSPNSTEDTYLIDKDGDVVHEWNFTDAPGLLGYLQEDGSLIRAASAASGGQGGNGTINAAGAGGRLEHVDWDGNLLWSFDYGISDTAPDTTNVLQHHDFEVMPNGNILMIAWEYKTAAEAIAAGRVDDPASIGTELYPDHIIEVDPTDALDPIKWEWHVWDHLGANDPGKIDINYISDPLEGGGALNDWTHSNGIDYNPELDQILLSVREFSEFWIIDHSTTTPEGPDGDLLYRWGNPQAYGAGDASDRQLFFQHDAKWVTDDSPGAGNITVFDNGYFGPDDPDLSRVVEITPPVDAFGNYPTLGPAEAYGPAVPTWTYTLAEEDFSHIISGTQRLENGNTLITSGIDGTLSEVTPAGVEVWRYVNRYVGLAFDPDGILDPEQTIPNFPALGLKANFVFRSIHYAADYAPQLAASVAGRHIFYNDSFFDDTVAPFTGDPAQNTDDDLAIPSKVAYLPGDGLSVYNNITNFTKGITGIMVDMGGGGDHASITAADFVFKHGTNNTPGSWATVAATPTVGVRVGDGDGGADRVTITWATGDIINEWLEVEVLATARTGLASADVHYWGNRAADSGEATPATFFQTTTSDSSTIFGHLAGSASVDNDYDYNRTGNVTTSDSSLVFGHLGILNKLDKIDLPAPAPAPVVDNDDDGTSAVASALAVATEPSKAAKEVRGRIDVPAVAREPGRAPARRFWHQLGEASDARASIMLVAHDAIDEALDLDKWLSARWRRV